jgi:hypothetical protein
VTKAKGYTIQRVLLSEVYHWMEGGFFAAGKSTGGEE